MHTILEYGLIECLLKTLSVISSIYLTSQDHIDLNKHEILVDDINSLIITLITTAIHTPGSQNIQVCFFIFNLLFINQDELFLCVTNFYLFSRF